MKRATVKIDGVVKYGPVELGDVEMDKWIADHKASWGTDAYQRLVSPAVMRPSEVVGAPDVEVSPAVYETVPATYELILEDITLEVKIREDNLKARALRKENAKTYIKNLDTAKLTTVASVKNVLMQLIDLVMED